MSKRREAAFVEPAHDGEVEVGERVTVLELTAGTVSDYRIGEGGVSPDSPLGSALLGRHVGDVVDVAHAGTSIRLEIVEIDG
jgi:transcription elongation GreA/GreB family factor